MRRTSDVLARGGVVLAGLGALLAWAACGSDPMEPSQTPPGLGTEEVIFIQRGAPNKIDYLWAISNAGSMCRAQAGIRAGALDVITSLAESDIDFHIAVTATRAEASGVQAGELRAVPQPIPGDDPSCYYGLDASGQPDRATLEPLLHVIRDAVACTREPEQYAHLLTPDEAALRCAFDPDNHDCADGELPTRESFFPDPADYRALPTVLRADDYHDEGGEIDVERLAADFACASMVGTQGSGFDRGLEAVARAVDPALTGEGGPNAGFVRRSARTAIVMISNTNDCTHDGGVDESSSCGVAECTFGESELTPVETLKDRLMANLAASKGAAQVSDDDVIVASLHGRHQLYTEPRPEPTCEPGFEIPPSCASTLGIAYSGHRYDAFVRQFPTFFPPADPAQPGAPLQGAICGHFGGALSGLFAIPEPRPRCIDDVLPCDGPEASCPAHRDTGEPGTCTAYPQVDTGYYCDSGIAVRLEYAEDAPADARARLESNPLCIPATIGQEDVAQGCVVDPVHYGWDACHANRGGLSLAWKDLAAAEAARGATVTIVYAAAPDPRHQ